MTIIPAGGILLLVLILTTGLALSRTHPRAAGWCAILAYSVVGAFLIAYLFGARYA